MLTIYLLNAKKIIKMINKACQNKI